MTSYSLRANPAPQALSYFKDQRRCPIRKIDSHRKPYGKKRYDDEPTRTQVSTLKVINITLTIAQVAVLSLVYTICPASTFDCFTAVKDLNLFAGKLVLKRIFYNKDIDLTLTTREDRLAVETLQSLTKVSSQHQSFCPLPGTHTCHSTRI